MDDPTAQIRAALSLADPADRARAIGVLLSAEGLPAVIAQLKATRRADVLTLRARGLSWGEIGAELGLHRNRAQQIGEGR